MELTKLPTHWQDPLNFAVGEFEVGMSATRRVRVWLYGGMRHGKMGRHDDTAGHGHGNLLVFLLLVGPVETILRRSEV